MTAMTDLVLEDEVPFQKEKLEIIEKLADKNKEALLILCALGAQNIFYLYEMEKLGLKGDQVFTAFKNCDGDPNLLCLAILENDLKLLEK